MHRYDVTEWDKHGWSWHKLDEPSAREAERAGEEKWAEDFGDFSVDVFHRMVSPTAQRREAEAGGEVWDALHDAIDSLPEVADLHERCVGDERGAGYATQAIIDTLIQQCAAPAGGPLQDAAKEADVLDALRALMERVPPDAPERAEADAMVQAQADAHARAARAAQAASGMIDGPDIRKAIRAACKAANERMDEDQRLSEAFAAGQQAHSGRHDRHEVARKVRSLVASSARLREIVQLAGRLKRIAREQQAKKPDRGASEYTGIELGAALSRVLPSEMVQATDPKMRRMFSAAFVDQRLQQLELHARPKKQQGPIVILLDSSASMKHNAADTWAAAVTMAFLDIAATQRRGFAVVHFGSGILRVDRFVAKQAIDPCKIAEAVSYFAADGGTNFNAALSQGIDELKSIPDADIIMVTDGQASVTDGVLEYVNSNRRSKGLHVYSILIGMEPAYSINAQFSDKVVELGQVLQSDEAMHALFGAV